MFSRYLKKVLIIDRFDKYCTKKSHKSFIFIENSSTRDHRWCMYKQQKKERERGSRREKHSSSRPIIACYPSCSKCRSTCELVYSVTKRHRDLREEKSVQKVFASRSSFLLLSEEFFLVDFDRCCFCCPPRLSWLWFLFEDLLGERVLLFLPLDCDCSWGGLLFFRPSVAFLFGDRDRPRSDVLLFRPADFFVFDGDRDRVWLDEPDGFLLDDLDRLFDWSVWLFRPVDLLFVEDRDRFCGGWLRLRPSSWLCSPPFDCERERPPALDFFFWSPSDDLRRLCF